MLVEFCYKFISVFFIYVTTSSWLLHVLQLSELYCVRSINMVISRKLSLSTSLSWHRPDTDTTRGRWWASLAREIDREHVLETSNFWLEFNWHYCTELTAFVWSRVTRRCCLAQTFWLISAVLSLKLLAHGQVVHVALWWERENNFFHIKYFQYAWAWAYIYEAEVGVGKNLGQSKFI